jgi:sugar phosphate isomerase/epimerase
MYASFNARAVGLTLSAKATIAVAASAGFAGVDLMIRDLVKAGEDPHVIKAQMNDLGLKGGAFPLPVNWRADLHTFKNDLADLDRLASIAADLGLCATGTWVMPELPMENDGPDGFQRTVDIHVERLGSIAATLARSGIALGLEVIGVESSRSGKRPRFLTKISELSPVLDPLQNKYTNVGVLLDNWHLFAASEPLEAALSTAGNAIKWVHLADLPTGASADPGLMVDSVRGLPAGHGAVDSRAVLNALRQSSYDGPVTAEPLAACAELQGVDAVSIANRVMASLRGVWPR